MPYLATPTTTLTTTPTTTPTTHAMSRYTAPAAPLAPVAPVAPVAPATRVAASASVLVREVVVGPVRPARVVAAGPSATYLDVGGRLLAVVAAGGVRLPCAAVLVGDTPPPVGSDLAVGSGSVHDAGRRLVDVSRWFDPRVRLAHLDPVAIERLAAAVRARPCADALLPADAVERLADHLAAGDAHRAVVAALVGRGSGLTPAGDDLVAGALAAMRAAGSPAADGFGAAVRDLAPAGTTRLSAALLAAADVGAVIPEAEAVLRALAAPGGAAVRAGRADRPDDLARATRHLLGVGHTSGWYLAAGLAVGAAHALASTASASIR
jgi:hypothetical protein